MSISPKIETKRLLILPFSERHLSERYVSWLNDKHVVRFSEQRHRTHSLESCRLYMESFKDSSNYFWAIEETEKKLGHIGNISAHIDPNNNIADIGILLGEKDSWQQGYGFEAFNAVCIFLLVQVGIRKVTCGTLEKNMPMLRIMQKMNMVSDGRRKRHYLLEGEEVDVIYMALYKENLDNKAR